jgi:hypothetical protein
MEGGFMAEGTRYIEVPATKILAEMRAIGGAIQDKGGKCDEGLSGQEIHFDFTPPNRQTVVRVYTSLGIGHLAVRECGKDAVRIVVGAARNSRFRPLGTQRRIYRTAIQGTYEKRVAAFLKRLRDAIRECYRIALQFPCCPVCNAPMALRSNKKSGHKFYGCVGYPECKGTRPANNGKENT